MYCPIGRQDKKLSIGYFYDKQIRIININFSDKMKFNYKRFAYIGKFIF